MIFRRSVYENETVATVIESNRPTGRPVSGNLTFDILTVPAGYVPVPVCVRVD